jgi:hypothetical protein
MGDSYLNQNIAVLTRGEVWGQVLCPCPRRPMPYALCPMPYEHLMLLRKAIPTSPITNLIIYLQKAARLAVQLPLSLLL